MALLVPGFGMNSGVAFGDAITAVKITLGVIVGFGMVWVRGKRVWRVGRERHFAVRHQDRLRP